MSSLLMEPETIDEPIHLADDDSPPDIFDGDDDDDHDGDRSRWLTVATFSEPTEAHIGRLKLESEDIDCIILDENLVATYWFWANAVGGIKLQVRESDFSRATRLLKLADHSECESNPTGSENIYPRQLSRLFGFVSRIFRLWS